MELELTEEQESFQLTTSKFLAAECPIATVRSLEADPAGFDAEWWRRALQRTLWEGGWTVASRLLVHERSAVGGASPYTSGGSTGHESSDPDRSLAKIQRNTISERMLGMPREHAADREVAYRDVRRGTAPPRS